MLLLQSKYTLLTASLAAEQVRYLLANNLISDTFKQPNLKKKQHSMKIQFYRYEALK